MPVEGQFLDVSCAFGNQDDTKKPKSSNTKKNIISEKVSWFQEPCNLDPEVHCTRLSSQYMLLISLG